MQDYEVSTRDHHEGVFSSHSRRASSCSSITSKNNQVNTEQPKKRQSVQLRQRKKTRSRVVDLRDKLYRSRLRLREKRYELRDEREIVGELDSKLMSILRQHWQQGFLLDRSALENIYTELEEKRDEVGSLQYEYDQAEDEQEMIEAELEKEEELLSSSYRPIIDEEDFEELDKQTISSQTSKSIDYPLIPSNSQQSEALYSQYQSRLGDARIMRERLQDHYIDLDKRKNRVGGKMDSDGGLEDTVSVKESKLAITEAKNELRNIEKDLDDMRKRLPATPIAVSQTPVPKASESSIHGQMPSNTNLVNRDLLAHCSDSGQSHVQIGFQGARTRFKKWILECLKNSSIDQVHRKAIGQADLDRIWVRLVLRRCDEFGEIAAFDPGDTSELRRPSSKKRWIESRRIVLLDPSGVSTAVHEYDTRFPAAGARHSVISWSAYKIRGTPYEDGILDLDLLSEYESRSV